MDEEKSYAPKALWAALAAAQQEFPVIGKDKENSHFKSRYADLATVIGATRGVLYKHGLMMNHRLEATDAGTAIVVAQLIHFATGQLEECAAHVPVSKADAQGYKSAVTYGKRITYETVLGLAPDDDDDGEAAVGRPASKPSPKQAPPPARAEEPLPKAFDTTKEEIEVEIEEAASAIGFKRAMKRIEGAHERGEITHSEMSALLVMVDETAKKKGIKP
jgi:hypothetical protein